MARYDHNEHAEHLRQRAQECRKLARIVSDRTASNSYEQIAKAYDVLAAEEVLMLPMLHRELEEGRLSAD